MELRVPLLPGWLRWLAVLGLAGVIFSFSILTAPPETVVDSWKFSFVPLDKWRHLVAYAVLGYALAYATTDWSLDNRLQVVFVVGAVILYGVGMEVGQSFVPDRYLSLGDAYANALGGVLVVPYYALRPSLRFVSLRTLIRSLRKKG